MVAWFVLWRLLTVGFVQVLKALAQDTPTKKGLTIEQFQEAELLVNITKHVLVPKHTVMTDEEKKTLLSK